MRRIIKKTVTKSDRELAVLHGLVDLYIKVGQPIGSQYLKENGFDYLSSATIRNYFCSLENGGFLEQQHTSGGRIPTYLAYRSYVNECIETACLKDKEKAELELQLKKDAKEITKYLHHAAEVLQEKTGYAVFLSSPRFDQDFIRDIRLFPITDDKLLCLMITDFGLVRTETLFLQKKELGEKEIKEIESFFQWKIGKAIKPRFSKEGLAKMAHYFYNEVMLRHVIDYASFTQEDIYRTGLSNLLSYPEFTDPVVLASSLAFMENSTQIHSLLTECEKVNRLTCWIGEEVKFFSPKVMDCSIIAVPYRIHQSSVGALALLGPMRMNFKQVFGVMKVISDHLSKVLTETLYKYKISYRKPDPTHFNQDNFLDYNRSILLEDKSQGVKQHDV